jgi:hypothetical protein
MAKPFCESLGTVPFLDLQRWRGYDVGLSPRRRFALRTLFVELKLLPGCLYKSLKTIVVLRV